MGGCLNQTGPAMTIDAHVHFWRLADSFPIGINTSIAGLARDFMPGDLAPRCRAAGMDHVVLIQAAPDPAETRALLELARSDPFIGAVVGWVDVTAVDCGETLDIFMEQPKFAGVRLMATDVADPDWLKTDPVLRGAQAVAARGLTADFLVRPSQLPAAQYLLENTPGLRACINHCGRPLVVADEWQPWADRMASIALFPEVVCKFSGLIERAGLEWSRSQIQPYVDHLIGHFGPQRLLFASNWPMIDLFGTYQRWCDAARAAMDILGLADAEKRAIFGGNASRFYLTREDTQTRLMHQNPAT